MILTFLGACANQTASQEPVSFLISTLDGNRQQARLLVDTGPGVVGALLGLKISSSKIDNVFLTHTHGDHFAGFPYFVWQRFYEGLEGGDLANDLHVFGSKLVVNSAKTMVELCYNVHSFPFKIHYHANRDCESFHIGDIRILPVAVDHTAETYGIVVSKGSTKFAYSADTVTSERFVQQAKGVDLLIHEGMWTEDFRTLANKTKHSTAAEAGMAAYQARARQLVLVHIYPPMIGQEGLLLQEASLKFDGPISVASGGMSLLVRSIV